MLQLKAAPDLAPTPNLLDKVNNLFSSQQPAQQQPVPVAASPAPILTESTSSNAFAETVADLEAKYPAGAPGAPSGSPDLGAGGGPAPEVIAPPKPFCTAAQCGKWLKFVFNGLENAHGPRWHLEKDEMEAYAEATAEMLNEQAPRWLAESPNKALYLWLVATLLIVGSRSESGEKLISWVTERLSNFGKPSPAQAVQQG